MATTLDTTSGPADARASARPTRSSHPRRRFVVGAVIVVVALIAGFLLFGGERPTSRSSDEALDVFRQTSTGVSSVQTNPPADTLSAPPAGVYAYRGSGSEKTSFPPLTEQQGPDLPGTVTAAEAGCWTVRVDYNTHHWQSWHYCLGDGGRTLTDGGGSTFARRVYGSLNVDNTSTFVCSPASPLVWPSMRPGDTRPTSCTGTSDLIGGTTTSTGTTTFVGDEQRTIGSKAVAVHHVRTERALSGAQAGTEKIDLWLTVDAALPVRNERAITVTTDTPFGAVQYGEVGTFELTSLEPRT